MPSKLRRQDAKGDDVEAGLKARRAEYDRDSSSAYHSRSGLASARMEIRWISRAVWEEIDDDEASGTELAAEVDASEDGLIVDLAIRLAGIRASARPRAGPSAPRREASRGGIGHRRR
jgi:hypothetical protein